MKVSGGIRQHLKAFEAFDVGESKFETVMNALTGDPDRIVSSRALAEEIRQIAQDITDEEDALAALVIAADIATHGFGMGEIHLRINAVQIRNAMRPVDGRTTSISDGVNSPRLLMERLAKRICDESQWDISFASLDRETATARRSTA